MEPHFVVKGSNGFYWSGGTLLELWRQQRDLQQQQHHVTTTLQLPPPGAASQRPPRLAVIGKSVSLNPYGADEDFDRDCDVDDDRRSSAGVSVVCRPISRHHSVDIRDHCIAGVEVGGGVSGRVGGGEFHPPPAAQRLMLSSPQMQNVRHHSMDIRPYHQFDGGAAESGGVRHYSVDVRIGGGSGLDCPELSRRPQSLPDNFRTGTRSADHVR